MSDTSLLSLQTPVYARLTGDATLMGKITGVFDYVPDKQTYPYVTIGEAIETPDNVFGKNGHQQLLALHVWSQARGFSEALGIVNDIMRLLDDYAVVVSGHVTTSLQHEDTNTMRDFDGITRHVIVRFRWIGQDA